MLREITKRGTSGLLALVVFLLVLVAGVERVIAGASGGAPAVAIFGAILLLAGILGLSGLFTVQPNQGKVLTLFGRYVGTVREAGLFWANPFYTENALSMLSERNVITLDDERKATMVSNLLVVLCSDRDAQPVLNTGSLYQ